MSSAKEKRYKKLLHNATHGNWLFLIRLSYVNAERLREAAWELYRGRYKEFSYNLFYISTEEFYKCSLLLEHLETKKNGEVINDIALNDLAKLFALHIFKIRGSQEEALNKVKKKRYVVLHQNQPDLNSVQEGTKMKQGLIKSLEKYTPPVFHIFFKKSKKTSVMLY